MITVTVSSTSYFRDAEAVGTTLRLRFRWSVLFVGLRRACIYGCSYLGQVPPKSPAALPMYSQSAPRIQVKNLMIGFQWLWCGW